MNLIRDVKRLVYSVVVASMKMQHAFKSDPLYIQRKGFDAATSDRTSYELWNDSAADDINVFLESQLEILSNRSRQEIMNNGMIEGMIDSHVTSVVGKKGPTLQIYSPEKEYNKLLEGQWSEWFEKPDYGGELSGVEILSEWIRQLWDCGEYLCQITNDDDISFENISLRIKNINARRLTNPYRGDHNAFMGIELDTANRKKGYWIKTQKSQGGVGSAYDITSNLIDKKYIIHGYKTIQPDQLRGIPWLSFALEQARNIREYDREVMKAARAAAMLAVLLHCDNPDGPALTPGTTMRLESGSMGVIPPGYKASQISSQQPSSSYVEYKNENYRGIGRAASIPLMMINLDSSGHSYSSARFDNQLLIRGTGRVQGGIESRGLNPLLLTLERESFLKGMLGSRRPNKFTAIWAWPTPPEVDPLKEQLAKKLAMQIGSKTFKEICAELGLDWEEVTEQLGLEIDAFDKINVNHMFGSLSAPRANATVASLKENKKENKKEKKKKKKKKKDKE